MRVLVIPSWYPDKKGTSNKYGQWGGSFFKNQCIALKSYGVDIQVFYIKIHSLRKFSMNKFFDFSFTTEEGVRTVRFDTFNLTPSFSYGFIFQYKLYTFLLVRWCLWRGYIKKPDLIHSHAALFGGIVSKILSVYFKCDLILTEHVKQPPNGLLKSEKSLYFKIIKYAKLIISPSNHLSNFLIKNYFVPEEKIKVIPNMIPLEFENQKKSSVKESKFTFIFVGLLIPLKRPDDLIRSFANLKKIKPNCRLIICGDGEMQPMLKNMAKELQLKLRKDLEFKGFLGRQALMEEVKKSDCLCSVSESETFGVSLLEALALGIPVIATKSGGPEDFINESNGLLIDVGDTDALTSSMVRLMENKELSNHEQIRNNTISTFSPSIISGEINEIYKKFL